MGILKARNAGQWLGKIKSFLLPHEERMCQKSCCSYTALFRLDMQAAILERCHRGQHKRWRNYFSSYMMPRPCQDLRRFLEEVGTDPREARYWLKYFQNSSEPFKPFAVIQVDENVFRNTEMLQHLASTVSFLHRNNMKCVIVHGCSLPPGVSIDHQLQQELRAQINMDSMKLASILEAHGAPARPLFTGTNILQASHNSRYGLVGAVNHVNIDPIKWVMSSNCIPIIQSVGETEQSQLVMLDISEGVACLAGQLQPLKVLLVNDTGGIHDEKGEVVANINVPADLQTTYSKNWCTNTIRNKVEFIGELLQSLPGQSSVVITSPHNLLAELFTHRGSGTFFKISEPVHRYKSLDDVDKDRLQALLSECFGRELQSSYFEQLESNLHTLYLSEGYNAAAIVTIDETLGTPYLDKFAISLLKQSEGVGDVLWQCLREDFGQLFWRSQSVNRINPWYFKKSEGSWSSGKWIVFWYGVHSHRMTSQLVDVAIHTEESFQSQEEVKRVNMKK